jgi:hypothetical protein
MAYFNCSGATATHIWNAAGTAAESPFVARQALHMPCAATTTRAPEVVTTDVAVHAMGLMPGRSKVRQPMPWVVGLALGLGANDSGAPTARHFFRMAFSLIKLVKVRVAM